MYTAISKTFASKVNKELGAVVNLAKEDSCSEVAANKAAQHLLSIVKMDEILLQLPLCDRDYHLSSTVVLMLLRAPDFSDQFVRLSRMTNFEVKAYNLMVETFDDANRNMCPLLSPRVMLSLQGLIKDKCYQLDHYAMPTLPKIGSLFFENVVEAGYTPENIVCCMSPVNMAAAAEALNKYGYSVPIAANPRFPGYLMNDLSKDQLMAFYDILKVHRGPYHAQLEMELNTTGDPMVFMSEAELECVLGTDLVDYVSQASSSLKLQREMLRRVMLFLREEHAIPRLDVLPKSVTGKLMKERLLTLDDLDGMPNTLNHFKREKLSHDLDI